MRFVPVLLLLLGACSSHTDEEMWSGAWTDPTPEVMIALGKKGVRGCGEFYQKENVIYPKDFAVACTMLPDGSGEYGWVGYEVFAVSEEVLGPDMTAVYMKFGGPPRDDPR